MTIPLDLLQQLGGISGNAADDFMENREGVPPNQSSDDDTEYTPQRTQLPQQPARDPSAPIPGGGPLLEEPDPAKVFKLIDKAVQRQERLARNRDEEGKHWDRIKKGVQFSILEKSEDQSTYRAILPPGVEDTQQPIPNKVLDLCNKQVSQILVDPPLPNPKPDGDSEENQSAMDLAKRFLRADGDTSGTNDQELWREVLTLNRTRKSAFVFSWIDATAGGWRPKQLMAHPQAQDPSNPLMGPALDPTGQPVMGQDGQPALERTTDPVLRYVGEANGSDGPDDESSETEDDSAAKEVFVDHAAQASREWLPKHRRRVLHPNQVRTLPATATAVEAHAIILLMWEPLAEAKKRFPQLGTLPPDALKQVAGWRPKRWKSIVPDAMRPRGEESGEISDQTLIFWYHDFCRISPDYPDGAEVCVSGAALAGRSAGLVLRRDTLREDVKTEDGQTVPVLMEPPIAQFRALFDVDGGDPFGIPPVSLFGGANEIHAHLYLSSLEDIDVRLHPNTFLTSTSSVTREDLNRRDGTPVPVLTKDDMPSFEQRPPPPPDLMALLDRVGHEMDTLANLNETAQGLDSSYSQSGEAKKVSVRQAKVQLAQDWQGFVNGVVQFWKQKLQLAQARLQTPQLVKIGGENTAYKARHFVGADLVGVSTVTLQPGTGTMMSPAEKAQYLAQAQQMAWMTADDAGELFRSAMSDDLGLPPSPHEEHIDRCIADWMDGPPDGWEAQYQAVQTFPQQQAQYQQQASAATQQTVAALTSRGTDPQTAQQIAQQHVQGSMPAPQQPPAPWTPFEARANDEEPIVAKVRYQKLSKLMSSTDYSKQPVAWRSVVDTAYKQAMAAAGVTTIREQQAAQQQQIAAQQQAEAAKGQQGNANAPPEWQAFVNAATQSVITMARNEVAKAVAVSEGIGPMKAPPDSQGPAQSPAEPPEPDPTALTLAHQSMESERNRAHELNMAQTQHDNTMTQLDAKNKAQVVGKKLDIAARKAAQDSGAPTPNRVIDNT